jgi:hypothetical protein
MKKDSAPAQITSSVMMIRPVNFGYNEETAQSNAFQVASSPESSAWVQDLALQEFNAFATRLKNSGVNVIIFDDKPSPFTPDSIFPNNWITFHEDGRVVLYPMQAHNRRLERKKEIITSLSEKYGFRITEIIDLSHYENADKFLEGTGSMIIDRQNGLVYACNSNRTHPEVLKVFCDLFACKPLMFNATDKNNVPVYHTNVMMAVGENISILCSDAIRDSKEKNQVLGLLKETGKELIDLSMNQMFSFAGNMLQVKDNKSNPVLVLSEQGYDSLNQQQKEKITSITSILHSDISHIEKFGGGSARCMLAEIFNPIGEKDQEL